MLTAQGFGNVYKILEIHSTEIDYYSQAIDHIDVTNTSMIA